MNRTSRPHAAARFSGRLVTSPLTEQVPPCSGALRSIPISRYGNPPPAAGEHLFTESVRAPATCRSRIYQPSLLRFRTPLPPFTSSDRARWERSGRVKRLRFRRAPGAGPGAGRPGPGGDHLHTGATGSGHRRVLRSHPLRVKKRRYVAILT